MEFNSGPILSTKRELPDRLRPRFSRSFNARIVRGLYDHLLTADSRQMLTSTEWKLTPLADRTGLRFNGTHPFEFNARKQPFGAGSDPSNIVDAGYAMGSIQIPGGGQPIILHRDAVSAGDTPWWEPSSARTWMVSPNSLRAARARSKRYQSKPRWPPAWSEISSSRQLQSIYATAIDLGAQLELLKAMAGLCGSVQLTEARVNSSKAESSLRSDRSGPGNIVTHQTSLTESEDRP